jgi:hypothetical protein
MIRIIIFFEVFYIVFRVYFLIYFICFRLESLFERDFKLSGSTKVLIYKINTWGEFLLGGDLIRAVVRKAIMEYEYPLI